MSDAARRDEREQVSEDEHRDQAPARQSAPTPTIEPGTALSTSTALALQQSSGNAAVLRLLRVETEESQAIGNALDASSESRGSLLQRQAPPAPPTPATPAAPTVDPAVKALWASTVVAPLTKAVEAAQGATIQDEDNLLRQAHQHIESARANVKTTAPQIKDDPALKGRMELLNSSLLRVSNKIVILVSPKSVTFKAAATAAQLTARDAAQVGSTLRPATPSEPTTTSPKTATAVLRALWKANVTDKLKPLHAKLVKGAQPDAAAALATVKAASEHVWALVPVYAATDEPMAAAIAKVGHRIGDLDNQLSFLAEGKKPDLEALAKDVEGRKGVAEGIF
jgi:hypothetical protein